MNRIEQVRQQESFSGSNYVFRTCGERDSLGSKGGEEDPVCIYIGGVNRVIVGAELERGISSIVTAAGSSNSQIW